MSEQEEEREDRALTLTMNENTKKVQRKREVEKKMPIISVHSSQSLRNLLESSHKPLEKSAILQISNVLPSELLQLFKENPLPAHFQGLQLVFHGDFFENCEQVNKVLQFLAETCASFLETLKLSCFDTRKDVNSLDFSVFSRFKLLNTLKIDLSFNELSHKSLENVVFAHKNLENLKNVSLGLSNCGLKDEFFAILGAMCEKSGDFLKKLRKIKLNLSRNCFEFKENLWVSSKDAEKMLTSLKNLSVNMAFCEKIDGFFEKINETLSYSLESMRKLCDLKLNLYYCGLSHENIEGLCENLVKRNENLNISLDLREAPDKQIAIKTIKAIEGMIALFRGRANPQKCRVFY